METNKIEEGYEVFVSDGAKAVGAVRQVPRQGTGDLTIYIENAGDFLVSQGAIETVRSQKVILNWNKLDSRLQMAVKHAHDSEDPRI